ncbi:MAG: sulfatase [Gemmatimonadota bacterium]
MLEPHVRSPSGEIGLRAAPPPTRPPRLSSRDALLMATWFALLTGLAEVAVRAVQRWVMQDFIQLGRPFVWIVPLSYLLLFALPALLLVFAATRLRAEWPLRAGAFAFALLGCASLLLLVPGLHRLAALALAVGVAVQVARGVTRAPAPFLALARRTTPVTILLLAATAAGALAWSAVSERLQWAQLPPARADAPNVLLIVLDTVRAPSLSLHGYPRPTAPRLERLAARGVRFDWALSTSPWTLPAHGSLFTGRFPHQLSTDWRSPLDAAHPTLAEALRARGYVTAGFVANTPYASHEVGLARGFLHYEDYRTTPGQVLTSSALGRLILPGPPGVFLGRTKADGLNAAFLRWLPSSGSRPFFAFLNYYDAHLPYVAPEPFATRLGAPAARKDPLRRLRERAANVLGRFLGPRDDPLQRPPTEEVRRVRSLYDASLAYLDDRVGALLDELERRGTLENTLVIVTSDHGEHLGEHGLFAHGNSLYLPLLHVPLLVSLPGRVPTGIVVRDPVSLRDVPATVLDLAGLEEAARWPGRSLARFWEGEGATGDTLLAEVSRGINTPPEEPVSRGDMRALFAEGLHYIVNGDGREELYEYRVDPAEERDLAASAGSAEALARLRARLRGITAGPAPHGDRSAPASEPLATGRVRPSR